MRRVRPGEEPHAAIVERVAWWADIFNVPCVGYVHNLGAIGDLVRGDFSGDPGN